MRPKRYPYSKQRFKVVVIEETYVPFTGLVSQVIEIRDTWMGKIIDYFYEVKGGLF